MKRAIDKALGVLFAIIAVYAGFAVLATLVQPYVGYIVGAVIFVIVVVSLTVVAPRALDLAEKAKLRREERQLGRWNQ